MRELRRGDRPKVTRKEHRNLTADDLWRLVNAATENRKAYVALLAFAGLRLSEALGLTWQDVDFDARVLRVRAQLQRRTLVRVPPKTARANRYIEIDDGLLSILRSWKARSGHSQEQHFVIVTKAGGPMDHHSAGRRLTTIVKAAGLSIEGLPKITPHQLRYTFAACSSTSAKRRAVSHG